MKYTALIKHVIAQVKTNKINGALKNFTFLLLISERTHIGLEKIILCNSTLCLLLIASEKLSCLN